MKKVLVISVIMLVIGMGISSSNAFTLEKKSAPTFVGNTIYVGGAGPGNYSTIQDAIDNASNGYTVFVFNESSPYYENIWINKSICLQGEKKNSTCIDGDNNGTVVEISADNVQLTNLTIQHSGRDFAAGVNVVGNNCIIAYTNIINNHYGLRIQDSNNPSVIHNKIADNNRDELQLHSCNHGHIERNTISRIDGYTVGIHTVWCTNMSICNNTVNKTYHGMYLAASTHLTIHNNYVRGCRWKAIMLDTSPDNSIKHNFLRQSIHSNYACDITLDNSPRCTVENNTLYSGLLISESYPNMVNNNVVGDLPLVYLEEQSDIGISDPCGQIICINCNNITIQNQEIQHTVRGIYLLHSDFCTLFNNTLVYNRQGIMCCYSNHTTILHNVLKINMDNGICITSSHNNTIMHNTIERTEDYGLTVHGINNTIAHNTISYNEYLGLVVSGPNVSIINNTLFRNGKGISIRFLSNGIIQQNTLTESTEYGVSISDSTNNLIADNIITESTYGIYLDAYCTKHTIRKNEFRENTNGLILDDAYENDIIKNNFINNDIDARFHAFFCKAFFNTWRRNYWDRARFVKVVWGTKTVIIFEHATKTTPRIRFDLFPALRPYKIGG
jgi:parallel beta-helix repeat protein